MANDTKKGRASLVEIQTWWKVPSIAHFCSLFRAKFGLPDFEIEELEEALITDSEHDPCYFLKNLLARILFGCYGKRDIGVATYDKYLRDIMKTRWEIEESRVNPLNIEDTTFHSLPTLSKVEVLHSLCDYRLDAEDVSDLLKGSIAEHMRIEPLGSDSEGAKYWYFYGTRLYKETKKLTKAEKDELRKKREKEKRKKRREKAKERAKEKEKLKKIKLAKKNASEQATEGEQNDSCAEENNQDTPATSTTVSSESDSDDDLEPPRWHIVCNTMEDWEALMEKFKKTKSKNEKELYRALADDFLPVMFDLYNEKDKALRKRLLEMVPRRTSGRIQEKRQQLHEDDYVEEFVIGEEQEEEDKFATNERRQRNRQHQKEMQVLEEQEAQKRKEEEEERAKKAKEDRAKRVQLREERAQLIAEGKLLPPGPRTASPAPDSSKPKRAKKTKRSAKSVRDDEFEALYVSMYKVLEAVKRDPNSWPFLEPVSEEYAPQYLDFIKHPMDIGTMEHNLDKKRYANKSEFVDDMHTMFENCETYNGTESEFTEMARTLEVIFTKMMLKCFPEDDIEFFDDEFFDEKCEPRRSSRAGRTAHTFEELDKTVFGSFRGDDSSEESDVDCYHPTKKKFENKSSPKKPKRPRRMPRVNYGNDGEDNTKDDSSRVHALRNFYSNRWPAFNADPTYGVTCSHMSVMRVVDGKIIEERGPLKAATQSSPTKDNDDDGGDKKENEAVIEIPVAIPDGMEVVQEERTEQSIKPDESVNTEEAVKNDPVINEDQVSVKNNLSSIMKHPKVRSKKERRKQAEMSPPAPAPVVSLPSTVFSPTNVSKAVPAILSKGNRLKQEMNMIAVDGRSPKLKTNKEDKYLASGLFVSNGPRDLQQTKSQKKNINLDKPPQSKTQPRKMKSPTQKSPRKKKNVDLDFEDSITMAHVVEEVTEHGVKKMIKLKKTSKRKSHPVDSTATNLKHSTASTSSITSLPFSTVSPTLPTSTVLLTMPTRPVSTDNIVHSVVGSTSSGSLTKQEMGVVQERASVITFLPNSEPNTEDDDDPFAFVPDNVPQIEGAGNAFNKNSASQLKLQHNETDGIPYSQYLAIRKSDDNHVTKPSIELHSGQQDPKLEAEITKPSMQPQSGHQDLKLQAEITKPSIQPQLGQQEACNSTELEAQIIKPGLDHHELNSAPILEAQVTNTSIQAHPGHQEAHNAPMLEAIRPDLEHQELYSAPTLEAQIIKPSMQPNPGHQEVSNAPTLEAEVIKPSLLPHPSHQQVYSIPNLEAQIIKPDTDEELYSAPTLEAQITKPSTQPHPGHQEVYIAPKLEAQIIKPGLNHQELYSAPTLEAQIIKPSMQPYPGHQEVSNAPTLEAEVIKPSLLPYPGLQELYGAPKLEAQIAKPSIQHTAHQEVYSAPNLEPQVAKPSIQPRPGHQETYSLSKFEAQATDSDLQDLIDLEALQEKSPRPTPSPTPLMPQLSSNKTFSTSPLMMNRVLLPNSLTINHMDTVQASHGFTQILQNPAPRSSQLVHIPNDQRYMSHLSGSLPHPTARLEQHTARTQNPTSTHPAILQHQGAKTQHLEDRLEHSEVRSHEQQSRHPQVSHPVLHHSEPRHPEAGQQYSESRLHHDIRHQYLESRQHHHDGRQQHTETRQQHPEARQQHSEARQQHPEARQQHSEARQQHSEARQQHQEARQQHQEARQQHQEARQQHTVPGLQHQKVRLLHPEARHTAVGLPQSSIQQPIMSRHPAGNMQMPVSSRPHPLHLQSWNHQQQPYQTQSMFQAQAGVSMPQPYQMSIPGHPSLQNGTFPPT